jgi:hypothetical protein
VVEAVSAGQFRIYAVHHIDQCLQLLTGVEPGARDAQGAFPPDTLNQRIAARLLEFAAQRRAFAAKGPEEAPAPRDPDATV